MTSHQKCCVKGSFLSYCFYHRVSVCHGASYNKVINYCWYINSFTFHLFHGFLSNCNSIFSTEAGTGWLTKEPSVTQLTVNIRERYTGNEKHKTLFPPPPIIDKIQGKQKIMTGWWLDFLLNGGLWRNS